jgi:uncharacterized protein YdeI (BOF family)
MMKRFLLPALTVAAVFAITATAYAVTMSIGEAAKAPAGTAVTVSGEVTAANGNDYTISDATDSVSVGFGPEWYKAVKLSVGEKVTVAGEVDKGKDGTKAAEVDGFSVTKADGKVETVRTGPGKPPWAGRGGPNGKGVGGAADKADDNCSDGD